MIGVYIPKVALDLVSRDVSEQYLAAAILGAGALLLLSRYISQKAENIAEYGFDKVQYRLAGDYLGKVFGTDFKNMENPDFLDLTERARRALYYRQGFHGYLSRMNYMLSNILLTVFAGVPVFMIHPLLALALLLISFFRYSVYNKATDVNKETFDDAMAGNWRKHSYLAQSTRDFSFAKDIRIFGMAGWIRHL